MPVLSIERKGRHKTSTRAHGEEARNYRGEERGTTESEGGTGSTRGRTKGRRGEEKELELLVPEERQVLVECSKHEGLRDMMPCTVVYKNMYYMRLDAT